MSMAIIFGTSQDNVWLIGLYFLNIFPIDVLVLWLYNISKWDTKKMLSNSKAVNTGDDKQRRQIVPVLK